jgi:hypothetical protein
LINYAPKYKFLFKVKFIFNSGYDISDFGDREFMYVIKKIDKPKVKWNYENVNMYNFRTKVLKSIEHENINMEFHDDIQNKVLTFFNAYRLAYSPISRLNPSQEPQFETNGMNFKQQQNLSASMSSLLQKNKNVLKGITLAQIFANGTSANYFNFVNPRIESFDFDDTSHEDSSSGGLMSVSFSYDALVVSSENNLRSTPLYSWGNNDMNGNSSTMSDPFSNPTSIPGQGVINAVNNSTTQTTTTMAANTTGGTLNASGITGLIANTGIFNGLTLGSVASSLGLGDLSNLGISAVSGAMDLASSAIGSVSSIFSEPAVSTTQAENTAASVESSFSDYTSSASDFTAGMF